MDEDLYAYAINYRYRTRPWFRKGHWKDETVTVYAPTLTEAYICAKKDGSIRFSNRKWEVKSVIPAWGK